MKKLYLLLTCALVSVLAGCASYQANSLSALKAEYVKTYGKLEDLRIGCKAYTTSDCLTYLGRDVLAQGYQPVQLTFYNQGDQEYFFSSKQLTLSCVSPSEVAQTVYTSTVGRVTGYTVGGLLLFPPLLIPAVVDGIRSSQANARLIEDFLEKGKDHFSIPPYCFRTTIIFVRKANYTPAFELSLINQKTRQTERIPIFATQ